MIYPGGCKMPMITGNAAFVVSGGMLYNYKILRKMQGFD
jgi:hypothetical protein